MQARGVPTYSPVEKPRGEGKSCQVEAPPGRRRALAAALALTAGALLVGLAAVRWGGGGAAAGGAAAGAALRDEVLSLEETSTCTSEFKRPAKPNVATGLNGVKLDDVCFRDAGPHHVFIIGDWGGLKENGKLAAVKHLKNRKYQGFQFVWPLDADCQLRVRDQMVRRAPVSKPDYVLNVGDNFYWGGVYDYCGAKDFSWLYQNGVSEEFKQSGVYQFKEIFEDIYNGPGLDGKMWLGVLGNHDWGGWRMDMAWDQAIGYTWSGAEFNKNRWMTPALYWYVTVRYSDFAVDYYFMDTNVWDALPYGEQPPHNICGPHNPYTASCQAAGGPPGRGDVCKAWFDDLWGQQKVWLEKAVAQSGAHWRVVVTHFPPYWGKEDWMWLAPKHELDAIITGHRHSQSMHGPTDAPTRIWPEDPANWEMSNFLDPTAWVVSGGGGGITSEHMPLNTGDDDQYGFVDLTLTKQTLKFEMISHGGQVRRTMVLEHHYSHGGLNEGVMIKKP